MNAPFAVLARGLTSFTGFGFVVIWLAISWASLCRRQKSLPISRARPALPLKHLHVYAKYLHVGATSTAWFTSGFKKNAVYTGATTEFRGKKTQVGGSTFTERPYSNTLKMMTNKESNGLKTHLGSWVSQIGAQPITGNNWLFFSSSYRDNWLQQKPE